MIFEKYNEYVMSNIGFPSECPACHGGIDVLENGMVCCSNPECPQKVVHKFANFFAVMKIDGAGERCVSSLVNDVGMRRISDLVVDAASGGTGLSSAMNSRVNGAKLRNNLLAALGNPISMSKFLSIFDFDGFSEARLSGLEAVDLFSGWYDDPISTLASVRSYPAEKLAVLPIRGFGSIEVKMNLFTQLLERVDEICDAIATGRFHFKRPVEMNALKGMSFCFTGSMEYSRDALERTVRTFGGTVKSGVSSNLDYLVQSDESSSSTKSKKARQLGVNIITPEQFISILTKNGVNSIL